MLTVKAHFDGRVFVPDEPVAMTSGRPLLLRIEETAQQAAAGINGDASRRWQPLDVKIDPVDTRAIAEDPDFDIENAKEDAPRRRWQPLAVKIDPALGRAIAEDPEFNIEES